MDQSEPLAAAVQEVQMVAAELREVKRRADQYGQASARLQEVSVALEHLANAVAGMQVHFHELLAKATSVSSGIEQARLTAEATVRSVPDVVERIEATDVSRQVGVFSQSIEAVNTRISAQVAAIENMQALLAQERDQQRKMFDDIAARSERVASDVAYLRAAAESRANQADPVSGQLKELHAMLTALSDPIASTQAASDKAANASTMYGHKGFQAVVALAKKVEAIQSSLDEQQRLLTAIKDKKGFTF